jgi:hypothetical protein
MAASVATMESVATSHTLVWIDAREAIIVRWHDGEADIERLASDVPVHRRSTGHVRHDPQIRHGGGGSRQDAGEARRNEHLGRFVGAVAERLDTDDALTVVGPGTVREQLADSVRDRDAARTTPREVACEPSHRLTDRQLIARVRHLAGADPRRRRIGRGRRQMSSEVLA